MHALYRFGYRRLRESKQTKQMKKLLEFHFNSNLFRI
jgi:hypothetical protein